MIYQSNPLTLKFKLWMVKDQTSVVMNYVMTITNNHMNRTPWPWELKLCIIDLNHDPPHHSGKVKYSTPYVTALQLFCTKKKKDFLASNTAHLTDHLYSTQCTGNRILHSDLRGGWDRGCEESLSGRCTLVEDIDTSQPAPLYHLLSPPPPPTWQELQKRQTRKRQQRTEGSHCRV